jgi:hypothetical protein
MSVSKQARKTTDTPFFWIAKDRWELAIRAGGHTCAAVYAGLCRLESDSPVKVRFFASAQNIAAASGVGIRTVEAYIPLLQQCGLIEKESGRGKGPKSSHEANRYTLLHPSACDAEGLPQQMHKPSAYESGVTCGHKRTFTRRVKRIFTPSADASACAGVAEATRGIRISHDGAANWAEIKGGLK